MSVFESFTNNDFSVHAQTPHAQTQKKKLINLVNNTNTNSPNNSQLNSKEYNSLYSKTYEQEREIDFQKIKIVQTPSGLQKIKRRRLIDIGKNTSNMKVRHEMNVKVNSDQFEISGGESTLRNH